MIVLLICSCAPKVIYRDGWGSAGVARANLQHHGENALELEEMGEMDKKKPETILFTGRIDRCFEQTDTPVVGKTKLKIKRKQRALLFFVDSIPLADQRNGADKKLAKAKKWMDRYDRNIANNSINLIVYLAITTPVLFVLLFMLISSIVLSSYVFMQILYFFLGYLAVFTWLYGTVLVLMLPDVKAALAYRKIRRSPSKSPADRRIEYEVRMLFMLQHVMSSGQQIKRIRSIREKLQLDPYNPWLSKLKELKYYHMAMIKN